MSFEPLFTDLSKQDYDALDGSQKKQILKSLKKIEEVGMKAGQELHGKLRDCRKLKHKKLGLRVIFKQSDVKIEIIEIVIVGKREDNEVYGEAKKRLGR
jgi:mRNA interferase RelE/StbE